MAANQEGLFPHLVWNRFNSDFQIPDDDDSARVAAQVKTSVDTWIQTSLTELEAQMNRRAQALTGEITTHIAATKEELGRMDKHLEAITKELETLAADASLAPKLKALQDATAAARTALAASAAAWEKHGADAVSTVKSIVGTMATIAV